MLRGAREAARFDDADKYAHVLKRIHSIPCCSAAIVTRLAKAIVSHYVKMPCTVTGYSPIHQKI
jgi:hypothetical protein